MSISTDIRNTVHVCLRQLHARVLGGSQTVRTDLAIAPLAGDSQHTFAGELYHLVGGYDQTLAFLINDGQTILERDYWDERLGFDIATHDDDPLFQQLSDEQWTALREYAGAVCGELEMVVAAFTDTELVAPVAGAESNDPLRSLLISYLLVSTASHVGELAAWAGGLTGQRLEHH